MYKNEKSFVTSDGQISDTFPCLVGVRQGETVSPLFFSIYLGDLQHFCSWASAQVHYYQNLVSEFGTKSDVISFIKLIDG